ncbi:hypothetical protein [Pseudomonas putida]|uniref:hypothetical protein n=1 Tax=Pseudomonas putida TaxID=303 RepID=UPI0018A8FE20|nr:hypothetical protein [Pseudomonas putida]MBF8726084.1 hypothetical protein [Pseudomonas putida]
MKIAHKLNGLLPSAWRFRADLRRLDAIQRAVEAGRPPDTREAHESGAIKQFFDEISDIQESRRSLITANYRRKAAQLSVPMPDPKDPELWEEVENSMLQLEFTCLTTKGEQSIRAAIREEQKHRREAVSYWFAIAVGLIGSITGLISAFK